VEHSVAIITYTGCG